MSIIVTGANGFLGRDLAAVLAKKNQVVGLDIAGGDTEHAKVIKTDLLDETSTYEAIRDAKVQKNPHCIIHLAAVSRIDVAETNPAVAVRINVEATANVVKVASLLKIPRVVYVSTGGVYGAAGGAFPNESARVDPGDIYAATKFCGEIMAAKIGAREGIEVISTRIFRLFGIGLDPNAVGGIYTDFFGLKSPLQKGNVRYRADQQVEFCTVSEVSRALALISTSKSPKYRLYNIGSNRSMKAWELAGLIAEANGVREKINFGSDSISNRPAMLDSSRFLEEFGSPDEPNFPDVVQEYARWAVAAKSTLQDGKGRT